ncbi:hypothetical protein SCHPADRAFT_585186 [Schizopora paradoxa]|uniref:Uncharacterized protein n=1 Tax=Schizopora paradoxa TaxID=27342 RepID=A0A0H2RW64_9AGAM|nr:hypothetical protein SCHPADRAFT_585186 [Schizopora paradoxa]
MPRLRCVRVHRFALSLVRLPFMALSMRAFQRSCRDSDIQLASACRGVAEYERGQIFGDLCFCATEITVMAKRTWLRNNSLQKPEDEDSEWVQGLATSLPIASTEAWREWGNLSLRSIAWSWWSRWRSRASTSRSEITVQETK